MPTFPKYRNRFVVLLLIAAALVMGGVAHQLVKSYRPHWLASTKAASQPGPATTIGFVDLLSVDTISSGRLTVSGWALSKTGVARVELVVNGRQRIPLTIGVPRHDVAQVHPGYHDSASAGFEGVVDASAWGAVQLLEVVATDKKGASVVLGRHTLPPDGARDVWSDLLKARGVQRDDVFYFVMGTSNLANGGAKDIDTVYRPYESETVKVGMRVPILYLRNTKGKAGDYVFDPDFPTTRKCGKRAIAEDNLRGVIEYAVTHRLPVLFTLNGGIWADASCDVPEWDANDMLEQDPANCQWNEDGGVMPDDYLKSLSGSQESPELARALTFNVHAGKNRHYKKRNLQQAGTIIREFATLHPDLFIGVNLDPDLYLNPFFDSKQWYDYNPDTLRQFREWLQGSGPYAVKPKAGEPDLSRYRRNKPLTLDEVNDISGRRFKSWNEVEPPRSFPTKLKHFWDDAWVAEWEHFRRHLVDLHYDELSVWLGEAGIGKDFIYSSQGFMAPGKHSFPFAVRVNSPVKNYDSGGMSIEGAVPSNGHLGAILYGESAINQIKMEGGRSLFSAFRNFDQDWAVIEHNTANLRNPERLPDFAEAYRSLREIHNHGARFISPMAWNGSRGIFAGQPGFVAYTALRDTPLEEAIKDFMISHANLPRRSRLWTFGAGVHSDGDGWVPSSGTQGSLSTGKFSLRANAEGFGVIESPDDLAFMPADYRAIVINVTAPEAVTSVSVEGMRTDGTWVELVPVTPRDKIERVNAGLLLPLSGKPGEAKFRRIRLKWQAAGNEPLVLDGIALYAH